MSIKGAGILPVSFHNNQILFLLGQEKFENGWKDSNTFSSFGGKREKNEAILDTAVREGYEESMGLLGSQQDIKKNLQKNKIGYVTHFSHRTYLYEIPYQPNLPQKFKNIFEYISLCDINKIIKICNNGLFEKQSIKYFTIQELQKSKQLRYAFQKSLPKILNLVQKHSISPTPISTKKPTTKKPTTQKSTKKTKRKKSTRKPKRKKSTRKPKRKKSTRKPKRKKYTRQAKRKR